MSITIVFPGQGSQVVGMGQDLYETFTEAKELFEQANDVLGRRITDVCFNGPEDVLTQTENAQVGLFLVSAALFHQLQKQDLSIGYMAGHSLGELTACYAAEVVDLETAIRLVVERGRFMSSCSTGAMAAILGQELDNLESELLEFESEPVVIANYNSPGQVVISGSKEGVAKACEKLQGLDNVKRVIPLKVGGPFHSPLMAPAADQFKTFIQDISFSDPKFPIVLNRTALTSTSGDEIKENLPLQIKSSVKWQQSIQKIGPTTTQFIECGSGKVLSGLIKKMVSDTTISSVSDCNSLQSFLETC